MPNTALNRTVVAILTNKSGGDLAYGDVVILNNTDANGFTTTTSAGLSTRGLGVIQDVNGIANNASGMVAVGGWVAQINLNTASTVGQFIKTHTVAGQGTPHNSPQVEGDFAVALTASATPAAVLFGSPNGPTSGGSGTVTNTGSLTDHAVIVGNGGVDVSALASLGTSGQALLSAGAGSDPAFGDVAPLNADYWVETANGTLSAEVVVGTTGITTATYASRQAAAKAGRLFLPSDSFYLERDTGAAWAPWGPIFPLTPPVDGDFSWVNQGGATVATTNGGIFLSAPATAGDSLRLRVKAAPSTPYTITAALLPLLPTANNSGTAVENAAMGLAFRQSSDGKVITFGLQIISGEKTALLVEQKWTNATTFSAAYLAGNRYFPQTPVFLRIADNGTNRICSISTDGINFVQVHTVGRTDFLTADQVGFYAHAGNATNAGAVTLISWKQG